MGTTNITTRRYETIEAGRLVTEARAALEREKQALSELHDLMEEQQDLVKRCANKLERLEVDFDLAVGEFVDAVDDFEAPPSAPRETPSAPQPRTIERAPGAVKRAVFEGLVKQNHVLVFVDTRRDGCDVPAKFKDQSQVAFRFGHGLMPPLEDMQWDDETLAATMDFGGRPHLVILPWSAVFGVVIEGTSDGVVWRADQPSEGDEKWKQSEIKGIKKEADKPKLTLVPRFKCWSCQDTGKELIDCEGSAGYRKCEQCQPEDDAS